MWRLRRKTERGWYDGFHIHTGEEAKGLCETLNKLERELNEAREETIRTREFMDYGFAKAQEELTDMTAQRDRLAAVLQQCREDSVELVTERDRINAIIASVEARQK
jgi:uncharacterized coiled-coil DUF342 family protein